MTKALPKTPPPRDLARTTQAEPDDSQPVSLDLTLDYPIQSAAGETLKKLVFRRSKRKDFRLATEEAKSGMEIDVEAQVIVRLTGLAIEDIDALDGADAQAVTEKLQALLKRKDNSEDRHPLELPLDYPFRSATGETIDKLVFRRSQRKDFSLVTKQIKGTTDLEFEGLMIARLTGLTVEDIDELDGADSQAAARKLQGLLRRKGDPARR